SSGLNHTTELGLMSIITNSQPAPGTTALFQCRLTDCFCYSLSSAWLAGAKSYRLATWPNNKSPDAWPPPQSQSSSAFYYRGSFVHTNCAARGYIANSPSSPPPTMSAAIYCHA